MLLGPGGKWKPLVSLLECLLGHLRTPGLAVGSRLRSWRGFLTFGWLCHRSQPGCAWSRTRAAPARICELSMEPFECEHKTPVSQGLGEGRGTEANLVATPLGCQKLPEAGQAAAVQTDRLDGMHYTLILGAMGIVPSGGRLGLPVSGCSELHSPLR